MQLSEMRMGIENSSHFPVSGFERVSNYFRIVLLILDMYFVKNVVTFLHRKRMSPMKFFPALVLLAFDIFKLSFVTKTCLATLYFKFLPVVYLLGKMAKA